MGPCRATGARWCRRNTFDLFRLAAWKLTVHNDALAELDPSYDGCPQACTRPEADMKRGCPDCLVSDMYRDLQEELRDEFAALAIRNGHKREHKWPWSMDKVIGDVGAVGTMDARVNGEGYDGDWTVPQRRLVSIIREERASLRHAKDEELKRDLKRDSSHGR